MKARKQRIVLLLLGALVVTLASGFVLNALQSNLSYFFSPSEVVAGNSPPGHTIRLGGLVEKGTLQRSDEGLGVHFVVTDGAKQVTVRYAGILPDLFSEGRGVIAQGRWNGSDLFVADQVLAKHDENYMPPEVAAVLKEKTALNGVGQ